MDNRKQRERAEGSEPEMTDISATRSGVVPIRHADLSDAKRSGSSEEAEKTASLSSPKRRGTGPRTMQGKTKSKQNALQHGIFSTAVLLPGEPRDLFKSLLNGLRDDLQPIGTLENIIVEEIATVLLRKRRMLTAEGAEIQKSRDFLEWDQARDHVITGEGIIDNGIDLHKALITEIENPFILQKCLDLLVVLKNMIKHRGFAPERDKRALNIIYGEFRERAWWSNPYSCYLVMLAEGKIADQSAQPQENASAAKYKSQFLQKLKEEIERLNCYKRHRALTESARMELVSLSRSIPDAGHLDHLLRYEVTLDRGIDRLLRRFERLQRMRRGQPLPPQIDVNVSSDE